jgi:hypothetical protein
MMSLLHDGEEAHEVVGEVALVVDGDLVLASIGELIGLVSDVPLRRGGGGLGVGGGEELVSVGLELDKRKGHLVVRA